MHFDRDINHDLLLLPGYEQIMIALQEDEFSNKNKLAQKLEQCRAVMDGLID
jgi:hypothetical protein